MNVGIIGHGGREHAIAWCLANSASVEKIYAFEGSHAMSQTSEKIETVPMAWTERKGLITFLQTKSVELVIIGPEAPLVAGLADDLRAAGILVFGPSKGAAQIEGSKQFAKDLMKKYNIPTARYETFTDREAALAYVEQWGAPIVIKADGLAAGKGVVVAMTLAEARAAIEDMLGANRFGDAGHRLVIEEYMEGEEASLLSFVDGHCAVPMVAAQDHKRIFDGDEGPNTGGMGAYAPAPVLTETLKETVMKTIVNPIVEAMQKEGIPFVGCLYTGLMITEEGPKVVEFNARFGDPETQVILPLLASDFGSIIMACARGQLTDTMVEWKNCSCACVIMASKGYPESSHSGDAIEGLTDDMNVFHSGTQWHNGRYETAGGRVLGVVAVSDTLPEALANCYRDVKKIQFAGAQYRQDIGQKAFRH